MKLIKHFDRYILRENGNYIEIEQSDIQEIIKDEIRKHTTSEIFALACIYLIGIYTGIQLC